MRPGENINGTTVGDIVGLGEMEVQGTGTEEERNAEKVKRYYFGESICEFASFLLLRVGDGRWDADKMLVLVCDRCVIGISNE